MHSDVSVKVCCLVRHRKFKIVTFLSIRFPTSNITADHTHLYISYKHQFGEDDPVPLSIHAWKPSPCFCQPSRMTVSKEKLFKSLQRDLINFFTSELTWTF